MKEVNAAPHPSDITLKKLFEKWSPIQMAWHSVTLFSTVCPGRGQK